MKNRLHFFWKSLLSSCVLMLGSMLIGELFIDSQMFNGFSNKPQLWFGFAIETAMATSPLLLLGITILYFFRKTKRSQYLVASAVTWMTLSLLVILFYRFYYFPNGLKVSLFNPGIFFGWILPGTLIITSFIFLSGPLNFKAPVSDEAEVKLSQS